MRFHAAAELFDEHACERDAVPLDHDIDVEVRDTEEQIAHNASHKVDRKARLVGHLADGLERVPDLGQDPLFEKTLDILRRTKPDVFLPRHCR